MQYGDPNLTWSDWNEAHGDADEATRLSALREYIFDVASRGDVGPAWANKKLAKLGITERISVESKYVVSVPIRAQVDATFYGSTRAEVLDKLVALFDGTRGASASQVVACGAPVFTSGPEDTNPEDVDPDAPTTVDATLAMLREIILLGHIAGPKYCKESADEVLTDFGLLPIPPRTTFRIARPVEAVMITTVEAYDEESARTVATWRWENDRATYQLVGGEPTGDTAVTGS